MLKLLKEQYQRIVNKESKKANYDASYSGKSLMIRLRKKLLGTTPNYVVLNFSMLPNPKNGTDSSVQYNKHFLIQELELLTEKNRYPKKSVVINRKDLTHDVILWAMENIGKPYETTIRMLNKMKKEWLETNPQANENEWAESFSQNKKATNHHHSHM